MQTTEGRVEAILSACLVLLGAAVFWGALRMPPGTVSLPGPGFLPRVLGGALVVTGVALLVRNRRRAKAREPEHVTAILVGHRDIAIAFLALCGVAALFERVGFMATATLFLVVMLRALAPLGWVAAIAASLAGATAAQLLFGGLLKVRLPGLPFGF